MYSKNLHLLVNVLKHNMDKLRNYSYVEHEMRTDLSTKWRVPLYLQNFTDGPKLQREMEKIRHKD